MTKSEAIQKLQSAIETIKSYSEQIRAIRGSTRDPDCNAQIAMNNKIISKYQNEINLYNRITEERFQQLHPTLTFRDIDRDLNSLNIARNTLVSRGPRFNPRAQNPSKKGYKLSKDTYNKYMASNDEPEGPQMC